MSMCIICGNVNGNSQCEMCNNPSNSGPVLIQEPTLFTDNLYIAIIFPAHALTPNAVASKRIYIGFMARINVS